MSQRKFSDYQLERLVKEGNGVSQIAQILGVSKGTVSKRLKQLKIGISRNVTLHHAGEIVKKEINAVDQLLKINENANVLLDRLMKVIEGDGFKLDDQYLGILRSLLTGEIVTPDEVENGIAKLRKASRSFLDK